MRSECNRLRRSLLAAALLLAFGAVGRAGTSDAGQLPADKPATEATQAGQPLVWDAMAKTIDVQPGDGAADFAFTVTNVSNHPITIEQLRPTCGCTVAEMPSSPWVLAPQANGTFVGTIDFRGKEGTVTKSIFVNSTAGTQRLEISVKIPTLTEAQRKENQSIAQKNRQAVFSGDCARCHVAPTKGLTGPDLFAAACGVCHFSANRSSVVPNILQARQHRDGAFWRKWISDGKEGTLMPAWSTRHGGPFTDVQIEELVKYAVETLPTEPPAGVPADSNR